MKITNTPEEWEQVKEKFRELYLLHKSPDWSVEKQLAIQSEIDALVKFEHCEL
jgi:hypothetical protein